MSLEQFYVLPPQLPNEEPVNNENFYININQKLHQVRDKFLSDFEEFFPQILEIKSEISGTHPIDQDRANIFINSQLSERRRRAAQNLINNTHYITFDQIFDNIEQVVIKTFGSLNPEFKTVMYVGDDSSSNYFISLIVLYYIIHHNFTIPIITDFLTYPQADFFSSYREYKRIDYSHPIYYDEQRVYEPLKQKTNNNFELVIFDDITYSGLQMERNVIDAFIFNNIYIGVAVITDNALFLLKKMNSIKAINYGILVKNLKNQFIEENRFIEYLDMLFYFNPYVGACPISLYSDYKIADQISTFLKELMFGPILPSSLNINGSLLRKSFTGRDGFIKLDTYEKYLKNITNNESPIITVAEQKNIKFIPFITGCFEYSNIDLNELSKLDYGIFILDETDDIDYDKITTSTESDLLVKCYDKLNRCPPAFYKELINKNLR